MGIYTPPPMQQRTPEQTYTPTPTHIHIHTYPCGQWWKFFYPSLHTPTHIQYMDYTGLNLYQIWYLLRVLSQITTLTLTYFDLKPCKPSVYATS